MITRWCIAIATLTLLGCPRHVVLDPEMARSQNDPDWTVHAAPGASATAVLTPEPIAPAPKPIDHDRL
jgi:hypothetical protein